MFVFDAVITSINDISSLFLHRALHRKGDIMKGHSLHFEELSNEENIINDQSLPLSHLHTQDYTPKWPCMKIGIHLLLLQF